MNEAGSHFEEAGLSEDGYYHEKMTIKNEKCEADWEQLHYTPSKQVDLSE